MTAEPVEVGQWRQSSLATVWEVLRAHPRRRGFYIVVNNHFPYDVEVCGRRELECWTVVAQDYFGGKPHPGGQYMRGLWSAIESTNQEMKR